jgi:hypothetical protein
MPVGSWHKIHLLKTHQHFLKVSTFWVYKSLVDFTLRLLAGATCPARGKTREALRRPSCRLLGAEEGVSVH